MVNKLATLFGPWNFIFFWYIVAAYLYNEMNF